MKKRILIASILLFSSGMMAPESHAQGWNVSQIGSLYHYWDLAREVSFSSGYAYVASGLTGLRVLNVSDPDNPFEIAFNDSLGPVYAVEKQGNYVYISSQVPPYFRVLDVSDPAYPMQVATLEVPGNGWSALKVMGNYAYMGSIDSFSTDRYSLRVIDISNPLQPTEVGHVNTYGIVFDIAFSDTLLYISEVNYDNYFEVADISQPINPHILARQHIGFQFGGYVGVTHGPTHNFLCFGTYDCGMSIWDVTNPFQISWVPGLLWVQYQSHFVTRDTLVYFMAQTFPLSNSGFYVFNLPDTSSFSILGYQHTTTLWHGLDRQDNIICGTGSDFLRMVDVSNPTAPTLRGLYSANGFLEKAILWDHYAALLDSASPSYQLRLIDLSNPALPVQISSCSLGVYAHDLAIRDSLIYVADGRPGLLTINVADPYHPRSLGHTTTRNDAWCLKISGNYLYMAEVSFPGAPGSAFQVFSLMDPAAPQEIGYITSPDDYYFAEEMCQVGDYVYLMMPLELMQIDVSDPTHPLGSGFLLTDQYASQSMALKDTILFIVGDTSMVVADISQPQHLRLLHQYYLPGQGRDISISGDFAYVAVDTTGLMILNISDPLNAQLVGSYNTTGLAYGVAPFSNNYACLADGFQLLTLDCSQALAVIPQKPSSTPATFSLSPAYPNPFNPTTVLRYSLPAPQHVTLKVFDIQGREVATLVYGLQSAGEHQANFDGTGLASGVYICKLKAGDFTSSRKLVLLK